MISAPPSFEECMLGKLDLHSGDNDNKDNKDKDTMENKNNKDNDTMDNKDKDTIDEYPVLHF